MELDRYIEIGVTIGAAIAGLTSTIFSHRAVKTVNRETSTESGSLKNIVSENARQLRDFMSDSIRDRKDVKEELREATVEGRTSRKDMKEDLNSLSKDVREVVVRVNGVEKDIKQVKDKILKSVK